jgi:hypothetical protein
MFFACTIIVAAALIATAFLSSTLEAQITGTQDANQNRYLQAIADRIAQSSGSPLNWGTNTFAPADFGLADASTTAAYVLDVDKVTRLNSQNHHRLTPFEIANASGLSNIAFGIDLTALLDVDVSFVSSVPSGADTAYTFTTQTTLQAAPTTATLHCYLIANNYQTSFNASTVADGTATLNFNVPTAAKDTALLVVFARAGFDERLTSFGVYNFAAQAQQETLDNSVFGLSPLNYILSCNVTNGSVDQSFYLSYSHIQELDSFVDNQTPLPQLIDASPTVIVACGYNATVYHQEWTSYPQLPLHAGSNFVGIERNVYSYTVTIDGVLYKLDLTLGGTPK